MSAIDLQAVVPVLRVTNARDSAAWYERLGFELEGEHTFGTGMPVYAFLRAGDQSLHLSEHEGDAPGRSLLYIYVADVEAIAHEFGASVIEQPWAREVHLQDPDGNRLRLGQRQA